jgi:FMN-dependent NADH-azoreductase
VSTLFRLDASIRTHASVSRAVADDVQSTLLELRPGTEVVRRDVGQHPIGADVWSSSVGSLPLPQEEWDDSQRAARRVVSELADELEHASSYLLAAPLYNWGVSQHFKTWSDAVMTDPRFGPRATTIAGRRAVLVATRGGDYRSSSPNAAWDHATGWMRHLLETVWGLEVTTVEVSLTLAPAREYLAHLRQDAAAELARARTDATDAGRILAAV